MKKWETDWLASRPVFYNKKLGKIGYNINDVIDFKNLKFNPEGLANYLDFGYSVFGQTPIDGVKFLRHSSEAWIDNGRVKVKEFVDPVEKWLKDNPDGISEEKILKMIKKKISDWEKYVKGNIVLPLSGGYDSRLLALMTKDKSRLRAFTFGVSKKQNLSSEVVHAKSVAKKLGLNWKGIGLGEFHKYITNWMDVFGASVHAHGMYHLEFYKKIAELEKGPHFLSGIFGDVWAGSVPLKKLDAPADLRKIGYTHGCNADFKASKLKTDFGIRKKFFEENRDKLNNEIFQIVNLIRMKIILISYLMRLPEEFGFKTWTPFLDMDIALGMLTLPKERRRGRLWQKELWDKTGLNVEKESLLKKTTSNRLNYYAMRKVKLRPLNVRVLSEIIDEDYVKKINKLITRETLKDRFIERVLNIQKVGGAIRRFLKVEDPRYKAYYEYLTLRPLEEVLLKRNELSK